MPSESPPLPGPMPLSPDEIHSKLSAFDSVPLFIKSLPDEISDDPALSALQNLAHEGTADEIAVNFKDQGNDYFKGRRFREAVGFYTQGIDAKPTDPTVREALLINRAACNLELQNYGSVLRDCSAALTLNPTCAKASYRSALALVALGRADEAIDCCERCLSFDGGNEAVKTVKARAEQVREEQKRKEREKEEREMRETMEKRAMKQALKTRHIFEIPLPPRSTPAADIPYRPTFTDASRTELVFPVMLHYPQHAMTDIIASFRESDTVFDHLSAMFPPDAASPEWDSAGEYVNDGRLVVYAITRKKRLLKVGRKMALRQVIEAAKGKDQGAGSGEVDGLELAEGCLSAVVVLKGPVEEKWVQDFKRSRDEV